MRSVRTRFSKRVVGVCAAFAFLVGAPVAIVGGVANASTVLGASNRPVGARRHAVKVSTTTSKLLQARGAVNVFVMLRGHHTMRNVAALRSRTIDLENSALRAFPAGLIVRHRFLTVPAFTARVTSESQLRALATDPAVLRVDVDGGAGIGATSAAPIIGATSLQAAGYDGTGVTIAVLDSGTDTSHPDLVGAVTQEACFGDNDHGGFCPNGTTRQVGAGSAVDDAGHGTHVAGILRSSGRVAPVGAAPGSSLASIKVTDGCSFAGCFYHFSEITAALDYLAAHPEFGVKVVNMSLGTNATFSGDCDNATSWLMAGAATIGNLRANGVLAVASAGNNSLTDAMTAPACLSGVVSVAASTADDNFASFSNVSMTTDVIAPGVGIVSDAIGGGTVTASGTSMASPATAACVALLDQAVPSASLAAIETALKATGTTIQAPYRTLPRINCDKAFVNLGGGSPPSAPRSPAATRGNGRAVLRWTVPINDGGARITGYIVTPYLGSSALTARTFNSTATTETLFGLTNGKSYRFRIQARNMVGIGPSSPPSNAVTIGTPSAPTAVIATARAKSATVQWKAPASANGAPITGYVVTPYRNGAAQSAHTFQSTTTKETVTGLTPGKTYSFRVAAKNARGVGLQSLRSNAVTPS
jgi:subtilisin family serine protease